MLSGLFSVSGLGAEQHKGEDRDGGRGGIQHVKAKTHELKAERGGDGRGKRRGHAKVAHALRKAGTCDDIGGDGCRGGVGEGEGRAMDHSKQNGRSKDRRQDISHGSHRQQDQSHHENCAARAIVEPPHERTHDDGDEAEEGSAHAGKGLGATQALYEERERREAHDVVREHAEVHEDDEHEVTRPQLALRPGRSGRTLHEDSLRRDGIRPSEKVERPGQSDLRHRATH